MKPEFAGQWPSLVAEFTEAVRVEDGNVFFEWSRSVDDSNTYYLVEGFRDADAGAVHVQSEHFKKATASFGQYVSTNPEIIYVDSSDITGWGPMAEISPS